MHGVRLAGLCEVFVEGWCWGMRSEECDGEGGELSEWMIPRVGAKQLGVGGFFVGMARNLPVV